MESEFDFQLTQSAETDLDGIIAYIVDDLSNPQAATDFMDTLQNRIREACEYPESGSLVHNKYVAKTDIRKKFIGNFIMYYMANHPNKMIYVLRIVYGKRNMDAIIKTMEHEGLE